MFLQDETAFLQVKKVPPLTKRQYPYQEQTVFKSHRRLYHSTLGLRVIKKKKKISQHPFRVRYNSYPTSQYRPDVQPVLSHRMCLLNSFRNSTSPQNRQLHILISRAFAVKVEGKRLPVSPFSRLLKGCKGHKTHRFENGGTNQIQKTGKREVVFLQPLPQTL